MAVLEKGRLDATIRQVLLDALRDLKRGRAEEDTEQGRRVRYLAARAGRPTTEAEAWWMLRKAAEAAGIAWPSGRR
jgi:hypothetical protein